MSEFKKLIPCLYLKKGKFVKSFNDDSVISEEPVSFMTELAIKSIDEVIIFDLSDNDETHEESLLVIRDISQNTDIQMIGAGNIKRLEDVKKLLYAGCKHVALNMSKSSNIEMIEEASKRFGKGKIYVCCKSLSEINDNAAMIDKYAKCIIALSDDLSSNNSKRKCITFADDSSVNALYSNLKNDNIIAVSGNCVNENLEDIITVKNELKYKGIDIDVYESPYDFNDFKLDSNGLIPVVVCDIKTDKVLMVAYMNEEAYYNTIKTGVMTYYSRSRQCLWLKGATSGNYQYVKKISADCDLDTLLAYVVQIGGACHTGAYSCFFNDVLSKEVDVVNPYQVFENVFNVILDRKKNPKEGSYTNYLFDKGIDKILKKVGEEATEIVIAAKNPEKEEVKYEIADFLYHVMVLMAECDLTWEDITEELANR